VQSVPERQRAGEEFSDDRRVKANLLWDICQPDGERSPPEVRPKLERQIEALGTQRRGKPGQ
jgi:hypothetical protein